DVETRHFLQAYAAGINQYLKDHKDSLLYLFDRYGIKPEPWTPADSIAIWMRVSMFFGGNAWRGKVAGLRNLERLVEEVGEEEAIRRMTSRIVDESAAIVPCEEFPLCEARNAPLPWGTFSKVDRGVLRYWDDAVGQGLLPRPGDRASHNWTAGRN